MLQKGKSNENNCGDFDKDDVVFADSGDTRRLQ
jgi:hypothetical protein